MKDKTCTALGMCTLAVILTVAIAYSPRGFDAETTPFLVTVFGFIGNAVITLLNIVKTNKVETAIKEANTTQTTG